MPLPNGVTPAGRIEAICPAAAWMGNRGILHDDTGRIVRPWSRKAWITCQLSFKGRNRQPLMRPGQYTELFFEDEATALAAGHRPCGECRRDDYAVFKRAWSAGNGKDAATPIGEIDQFLHEERTGDDSSGAHWQAAQESLPAGVMVEVNGAACLWNGSRLLRWTARGYATPDNLGRPSGLVRLITPPSVVRAIAAGYAVRLLPSCL
ncbi:hypothetical protein [Cupriavidus sp. DF5525]|uniref:hypothetical protein n=1 Tax=Cupriavidus sp. DF5525 TaxID=3160989 RepID=UPI0032DF97EB